MEGDLDHFRVVVEALSEEHDVMEIALAAVKVAHRATGGDVEAAEEIASPPPPRDFGRPAGDGRRGPPPGRDRAPRGPRPGMARIFISAGRDAGIRPQDLVGAIAGESGIPGRDVGAIDIADRFSLVEVPEEAVDDVIDALRTTRIKGRKIMVRRDREA